MQKERSKKLWGSIALLICTIIWGSAFVMQSKAGEYVSPFYLNALRFFIGGVFLIPFVFIFRDKKEKKTKKGFGQTIFGGILVGLALCVASNLQQAGVVRTTPGKAGFLTAMNIIFVPILSFLLFRRKINWKQIAGIVLAVLGVGLLTMDNSFSINLGDVLCLGCAFAFAVHIMLVDHYSKKGSAITLSMVSFFACSVFSLCIAVPAENLSPENLKHGLPYILYLGIFSCGIAYTLQAVGQKRVEELPATLLLSLESVFSAVFSFILLKEDFDIKEICGCILMLTAVIVVQVLKENKNEKSSG